MIQPSAGVGTGPIRQAEVGRRLDTLRGILEREGLTACFLRARRNVAWLTAGASAHVLQSSESAVAGILVTRDEAVALTHNNEAARLAEEELAGIGIPTVGVPWWEDDALGRAAAQRSDGTRPAEDDALEAALVEPRSVLSPFDQARLMALGRMAREAVDGALGAIEPGSAEQDLAADLQARLPGVRSPVVLVAADDRVVRYRHPLPGPTPIRRRVMLVLVAEAWGLHVALTRFRELERAGDDLDRRLAAVTAVRDAMHAATAPGRSLGDVLDAARVAYAEAGFADEWREHHQGGSIGYQARERVAVPGDPTPIRPGMAFAWNPSIAGTKVEDTIVVDGDGSTRSVTSQAG